MQQATQTRIHITDEGPKPCDAESEETCRARYRGEKPRHFTDPQEAEAFYQGELAKEYGMLGSAQKRSRALEVSPSDNLQQVYNQHMHQQAGGVPSADGKRRLAQEAHYVERLRHQLSRERGDAPVATMLRGERVALTVGEGTLTFSGGLGPKKSSEVGYRTLDGYEAKTRLPVSSDAQKTLATWVRHQEEAAEGYRDKAWRGVAPQERQEAEKTLDREVLVTYLKHRRALAPSGDPQAHEKSLREATREHRGRLVERSRARLQEAVELTQEALRPRATQEDIALARDTLTLALREESQEECSKRLREARDLLTKVAPSQAEAVERLALHCDRNQLREEALERGEELSYDRFPKGDYSPREPRR